MGRGALMIILDHGTDTRYAGGCRCADCRQAHAIYSRESYARRKAAALTAEVTAADEYNPIKRSTYHLDLYAAKIEEAS